LDTEPRRPERRTLPDEDLKDCAGKRAPIAAAIAQKGEKKGAARKNNQIAAVNPSGGKKSGARVSSPPSFLREW